MAPNKFEKHIKKQLEEREIAPSANAWERVSEKLDTANPKQKTTRYLWYAVAASLLVALVTGLQFFASKEHAVTNTPEIVNVPNNASEEKLPEDAPKNSREIEKISVVSPIEKEVIAQSSTLKKTKVNTNNSNDFEKEQLTLAENDKVEIPKAQIDLKIEEVILQLATIDNKAAISDTEIDSMLRKAQSELLEKRRYSDDISVNAQTLLADVEDELDKSFRDQVFEALKEGFVKARTAVADRNK